MYTKKVRYGSRWDARLTDLEIEIAMFLYGEKAGIGFLGKFDHFKNIVLLLKIPFIWNPWSEEIIRTACETNYLGITGCASSTKSHTIALWLLVNWICDPKNTLCLIFSTSLTGAKLRIWASIKKLFYSMRGLPGKIVDNPSPAIQFIDDYGKRYDTAGLRAFPSERGKAAEFCSNAQGIKAQKRMFVVVDEAPGCASTIVDTLYNNTRSGNPYFWGSFIGNATSRFDPHGQFCTPKAGWATITVESTKWESKWREEDGITLHFDSLQSPNYVARENIYPFMQKWEVIDKEVTGSGTNTMGFWTAFRGFWPPAGMQDTVFSEADIISFEGYEKPIWKRSPMRLGGLDPCFSVDGDKAMASCVEVGETTDDNLCIYIKETQQMLEDVTDTHTPVNFQRAKKFGEFCDKHGIKPKYSGYDATGGGTPFGEILSQVWASGSLAVNFGGAASDEVIEFESQQTAKEQYKNRATELIYNAVQFLRHKQLKGITTEIAIEWCNRKYLPKDQRICVEPKKEFKARNTYSPDTSDAVLVCLAVCRERLGLIPGCKKIKLVYEDKKPRDRLLIKQMNQHSGGWGVQK